VAAPVRPGGAGGEPRPERSAFQLVASFVVDRISEVLFRRRRRDAGGEAPQPVDVATVAAVRRPGEEVGDHPGGRGRQVGLEVAEGAGVVEVGGEAGDAPRVDPGPSTPPLDGEAPAIGGIELVEEVPELGVEAAGEPHPAEPAEEAGGEGR
jgi:hypothetical protein